MPFRRRYKKVYCSLHIYTVSQRSGYKHLGEIGYTETTGTHIEMYGRKRFSGTVMTTEN